MRVRLRQWLPVIAVVLVATAVTRAQSGSGSNPVSGSAQVLDVAGGKIRVVTMATGLFHPWSLAFLPDGRLLVAERNGKLRIIAKDGVLSPEVIWTSPTPPGQGADALHGLAVHPKFAENKLVYMSYPKNGPKGNTLAVSRGRLEGDKLTELAEVFVADAWETSGNLAGHMMFGPDSTLYLMVGDRDRLCCTGSEDNSLRMKAQALDNHVGKTLRLKDDGGVPADNPFVGKAGAKPEIFTYGHRNGYGLSINPQTGELWQAEIGPMGGDEVNVLVPGHNYGWPLVSMGRNYTGTLVSDQPWSRPGMDNPRIFWVPSISLNASPSINRPRPNGASPCSPNSVFESAMSNRDRTAIYTLLRKNEPAEPIPMEPSSGSNPPAEGDRSLFSTEMFPNEQSQGMLPFKRKFSRK